MAPEEQLPGEMKVVKDPEKDLSDDPRIAQPPPSSRAMLLAMWAAVAVIVAIGLYLVFPGKLDEASEITRTPAVAPLIQETPKDAPTSPSGDDTQAKTNQKSQ